MIIGTVYSHYLGFEKIIGIIKEKYPKGSLTIGNQEGIDFLELEIKGGIFSSSSKLKIVYRQRYKPSYQLLEDDNCPLSHNLKGWLGYVSEIPAKNEKIKQLLLHKITTINCEFSVIQEQGNTKDLKELMLNISKEFDAYLFVEPNSIISRSTTQHILNKDLELILDTLGNCEIYDLEVKAESKYFK